MQTSKRPERAAGPLIDLGSFLPYRLAVLAEGISFSLAGIYAERFALTRQEWRILAVLGAHRTIDTKGIGRATSLDKMQVSRAMRQLEHRALVVRRTAAHDRRNKTVLLTDKGRALYAKVAPLVLAQEKEILRCLSRTDIAALERIIAALLTHLETGPADGVLVEGTSASMRGRRR